MLEHEMQENFPRTYLCTGTKADTKKSKSEWQQGTSVCMSYKRVNFPIVDGGGN